MDLRGGRRGEVVPSVSGMGIGTVETAAGLAALSLREPALDKRLAPKLAVRCCHGFRYRAQTKDASLLAPLPGD
ncbi:hypothetical protein DXC92_22665 [Clostridiales bacterium TF09-2AC]|nr:hypothetical protein DXC92_22665 [Clostridiales bacterium TF09-2AC]